jgi:hypothetical protein
MLFKNGNEECFMKQQQLFYEDRFLESWAGAIITKPETAIVELVANCWDAYATEVNITWPDIKAQRQFSIIDNGIGMTKQEFDYIWRAMSYNRVARYGSTVQPPEGEQGFPRPVFGRNGKGRFASFCFSDEYLISSIKAGEKFTCRVCRTIENPLVIEDLEFIEKGVEGHGTEIKCTKKISNIRVTEERIRESLGSRFLANPSFRVLINGRQISFNDISDSSLSTHEFEIRNLGKIKILHIDTLKADKTTRQHGIAWWVLNRAVGECKWSGTDYQRILDGRTSEAKRYTFIVQADFLSDHDAIKEDWSWFKDDNETWKTVHPIAQDKIKEIIHESNKTERESRRKAVYESVGPSVNALPLMSKDRVRSFINEVIETCPNFGEIEIIQISTILANLEKAKSQYGLLEILHNQESDDLDALYEVLSKWTIDMAKIVLDEIQTRLRLINELKIKIEVKGIDEVHELQPLFEKGLWMFGPQFESIEFTSNRGMTNVIRNIFGDKKGKGSLNRPDFLILPDSSVGFYARSSYDEDYNENGCEHVVIVDLKTTGLPLGSKEKDQIWKYVKELKTKGYIRPTTQVDGFVLGDQIEDGENEPRKDGDRVKIIPMLYSTILLRAEKRMLNLHERVKTAPFLVEQGEQLESFLEPVPVQQQALIV